MSDLDEFGLGCEQQSSSSTNKSSTNKHLLEFLMRFDRVARTMYKLEAEGEGRCLWLLQNGDGAWSATQIHDQAAQIAREHFITSGVRAGRRYRLYVLPPVGVAWEHNWFENV